MNANATIARLPTETPAVRSVTRSDRARFEATMTTAFSADPAARWDWPDPLQFIEAFMPLVTLFGGKSLDHGSAYVIGDFLGVVQWLPPEVLPDDGPIAELFERNMSEPKLGEVLSLFEQMASFHPHDPKPRRHLMLAFARLYKPHCPAAHLHRIRLGHSSWPPNRWPV